MKKSKLLQALQAEIRRHDFSTFFSVTPGSKMGYHFNHDAISEMVKLVEHVLADHREILKERPVADAFGDMLDKFVSVWLQAMGLTFRLDEAIR